MPILDIKIYPDQILRKKAIPIGAIGEKERRLSYNMIETMRHANGVGLAAPQVGISKRIIVVMDTESNNLPIALINPRIVSKKGRSGFCEGCLSIPEITASVTRPERIRIEALNLDGEKLKISTNGVFARILQHEIDHLDGILFIDRVGFLKRRKIMRHLSSKICMKL